MAMSHADVQRMIDFSISQVRNDFNAILQSDGAATVREITLHRVEIETHRATHFDHQQRFEDLIHQQNAKFDEVMVQIEFHKNEIINQMVRVNKALDETQQLDSRLIFVNGQVSELGETAKVAIANVTKDAEITKKDIVKEFENRRNEMVKWFDEFKGLAGPPGI